MNDLDFLAAQQAYLFAPKGKKLERLAALRSVVKRLLKPRKMKRRRVE